RAFTDKLPEAVATPNVRTIEELSSFMNTTPKAFIKTLIYKAYNSALGPDGAEKSAEKPAPESFYAVCIRGDLDVNEVKLAAALKASEVELADDGDVVRLTGAPVGFAGPVGLTSVPVLADESVSGMHDAVTGALKADLHYTHVEPGRDFTPLLIADVRTVKAGDRCPVCNAEFYSKKGNELGHIFKLGYKYTKSMNVTYLDENGKQQTPVMGCYGIGVDRTLASVIEEHNDSDGIIWPVSVAPFHIIVVPIKYEGAMKAAADTLYRELSERNLEVLLDDRDERPGVKFKDADLMGIPLRIVVGEKNLPQVEIKERRAQGALEKDVRLVPLEEAADYSAGIIRASLEALLS
ncbi:MAG: proline--tRNA ligase, partial [Spirochaetaceae bacterium]|nr:proline--tRNA ligase [Spirochaetaceae bacterium]